MLFCLNKMIVKDENAINKHYLPFLKQIVLLRNVFV